MHLCYEKSKILTSIPQNLVIYHIKILCQHIKNILFYLCLKYGEIRTNIFSHFDSFSIKLHSGTQFLNHFLEHLEGHVLIIQIKKIHHHFNQEVCEYPMKKNYQIDYFVNVMVIESSVLKVIWAETFFLCTPTMNVPKGVHGQYVLEIL
jgi:hypothetical protein